MCDALALIIDRASRPAPWHHGGSDRGEAKVPTSTILRADVEADVGDADDLAERARHLAGPLFYFFSLRALNASSLRGPPPLMLVVP